MVCSGEELSSQTTIWRDGWRKEDGTRAVEYGQEARGGCDPECAVLGRGDASMDLDLCAATGVCFANEGSHGGVVHAVSLFRVSCGGNYGGDAGGSQWSTIPRRFAGQRRCVPEACYGASTRSAAHAGHFLGRRKHHAFVYSRSCSRPSPYS